jgi:anthranilate phosphoribosyltransferase
MIEGALALLKAGKHLPFSVMQDSMEEIMTGRVSTADIVLLLTALREKGETVEELTAAVTVMRRHMVPLGIDGAGVLDTCGTGGDAQGTFNISTAVSFVAAGAGVKVAKHGNRAVSSASGSADVLEALGVNLALPPADLKRCLDECGIVFLFAPQMHPAMMYAMPARKQIVSRTMFNMLGPLTNPAHATQQLIGVFDRKWVEPMAKVLGNLGTAHAVVVHGHNGLDEISTTGPSFVAEFHRGIYRAYTVTPQELGMYPATLTELAGGNAQKNAEIIRRVLSGENGPARDIVVLNAAAALYAADRADSILAAVPLAQQSIDSKSALRVMERFVEFTRSR